MTKKVSIHAPHEGERLRTGTLLRSIKTMFQSTLPTRGSDARSAHIDAERRKFQSTLPTRGSDIYNQQFIAYF